MTRAAITPAGRTQAGRSTTSAPHRGPTRSTQRPSGTTARAGKRAATARKGPDRTSEARRSRRSSGPSFPRRVSGPLRGLIPAFNGPSARPAPAAPLVARVLIFVRSLPDHPLLDRIVRGRAWIPLLGVMLAGIVAMQVEVLKLGASIGRSIERGSSLQARNEALRASVASLDDDQRIEALAANRGMVMPSPAGVGFLSAGSGRHMQQVLGNIHVPDASTFLSLMTSNGAVQTGTSTDPLTIPPDPAAAGGSGSASAASTDTSSADSGTASTTGTGSDSSGSGTVSGLSGASGAAGTTAATASSSTIGG